MCNSQVGSPAFILEFTWHNIDCYLACKEGSAADGIGVGVGEVLNRYRAAGRQSGYAWLAQGNFIPGDRVDVQNGVIRHNKTHGDGLVAIDVCQVDRIAVLRAHQHGRWSHGRKAFACGQVGFLGVVRPAPGCKIDVNFSRNEAASEGIAVNTHFAGHRRCRADQGSCPPARTPEGEFITINGCGIQVCARAGKESHIDVLQAVEAVQAGRVSVGGRHQVCIRVCHRVNCVKHDRFARRIFKAHLELA